MTETDDSKFSIESDYHRGFSLNTSRFIHVLHDYPEILGKNIVLVNFRGDSCPPDKSEKKDTIYIKLFSTPVKSTWSRIGYAYGEKLDSTQSNCLVPTDTLMTVYDPFGYPVAEFSQTTIYILFYIAADDLNQKVLLSIMDDYVLFMKMCKEGKRAQFKRMMLKRKKEASKNSFFFLYTGEVQNVLYGIEREEQELNRNIVKVRNTLVDLTKRRSFVETKISAFRQVLDNINPEVMQREYAALQKLSVTGKVEVEMDSIRIPVGQIDITYKGFVYDIGDFDILLNPASDCEIKCINKTRSVDGFGHPHIENSGEVCFGTIDESIATLMSQMEYAIVVQIMIDFLHTCNKDGWYRDVTFWPVKGAECEQTNDSNS